MEPKTHYPIKQQAATWWKIYYLIFFVLLLANQRQPPQPSLWEGHPLSSFPALEPLKCLSVGHCCLCPNQRQLPPLRAKSGVQVCSIAYLGSLHTCVHILVSVHTHTIAHKHICNQYMCKWIKIKANRVGLLFSLASDLSAFVLVRSDFCFNPFLAK